jgi:hypothetical protein
MHLPGGRSLRSRFEAESLAASSLDSVEAACDLERSELAQREAAGDVDPAEAERMLASIDAKASQARSAAAQRRRVAAALEEAVDAERERQESRRFEWAVTVARKAAQEAQERSERIPAALETLAAEVHEVEALRARAGAAFAAARELCPDDVEMPEVAVDEAAWPDGVDAIVTFLQAGPRQPNADGEVSVERARVQRERADRELIVQAVEEDLTTEPSMLQAGLAVSWIATKLPEHLREQAREELHRRVAVERERRLARA